VGLSSAGRFPCGGERHASSIKEAGNKSFTIVPLEDSDVLRFFINHAAQVWAAAAVKL
jgi:hypothetical protein